MQSKCQILTIHDLFGYSSSWCAKFIRVHTYKIAQKCGFFGKFCSNFIKFQKNVDDKLLDPAWWNFAWNNGKLCAFRQNQLHFLNISTLGAIKVLLVTVDIESRV